MDMSEQLVHARRELATIQQDKEAMATRLNAIDQAISAAMRGELGAPEEALYAISEVNTKGTEQ